MKRAGALCCVVFAVAILTAGCEGSAVDGGAPGDASGTPDTADAPWDGGVITAQDGAVVDVVNITDAWTPGGDVSSAAPDASSLDAQPLDAQPLDTDLPPFRRTDDPLWPTPNAWSWDGSWRPAADDLPLDGMLDDEYFDGHTTWDGTVSPVLPPGAWDWNDWANDLAGWRSFRGDIGDFEALIAPGEGLGGRLFGWRLLPVDPEGTQFSGAAHLYEFSPGVDIVHLGPGGIINSDTEGNMGGGPDVLVFDRAWSLDFFTGVGRAADPPPAVSDNDLVVAGCTDEGDASYGIMQTSIHTGPGSDWVFARDVRACAFDLGNGDGGVTAVRDPNDGDDLAVIRGNAKDFRVFGGVGDDTVVWYLDDIRDPNISFLGPNLFGGGGAGGALWDTSDTDRLVLVIPPSTTIVDHTPVPPGALMVRVWFGDTGDIWWDEPVYELPTARYCVTCGVGPEGQRTLNLEYHSADSIVQTGWFWVTDFEELQLGTGPDARLFRFDVVEGGLVDAPDLQPYTPPGYPWFWCDPPRGAAPLEGSGPDVPPPPDDTLYWPPEEANWPPPDAPLASVDALYPQPEPGTSGWPAANVYSWDGSWTLGETPFVGLFDNEYNDAHINWDDQQTEVLPPGRWDWDDEHDDYATWRGFADEIGRFAPLLDAEGRQFGWRLDGVEPEAVDYSGSARYFEGSSGTDILDLGPAGLLHSFEIGDLGDGPDVLVFDGAWSLDFRTGNSLRGSERDNDLVVAGCSRENDGSFRINGASIHTGPGSDWIFARDTNGAAFDAGNGDGGRTDTLDPQDGDDLVVLGGAIRDVRVFGGAGDDVLVWYLDDNGAGDISYAGPNFFGAGGAGDAIWDPEGSDRLVLVIPSDTAITTTTPVANGALLFRLWDGDTGEIWWDDPVYDDPRARYCITCGVGPAGQRTLNLDYHSIDGRVVTGWFWVTNFDELQLGLGADAALYRIDQTTATLTPAPDLSPYDPPDWPWGYCE